MKKSEKLKVIDELIEKAAGLTYDINSHPQTHIVNDALSFVRNTLEEKNAIQWDNQIRHVYWGVSLANSQEAENTRVFRWHNGKDEFIGILKSIKQEIELFAPNNIESSSSTNDTTSNDPIIFLSHSSTDESYGNALEKIITGLGVKNEQLIYTSHPLHKIPIDKNIYDYLRVNINKNIFTIFLWSDKYLDSPACLNEMGAAWVTQSDYTNIFSPDFNFGNPKFSECAVDIRKMGIVLKGDKYCKTSMIELKDKIVTLFDLPVDEKQSSFLLDDFIEEVLDINKKR